MKKIISDFGDLSDEDYAQLWAEHEAARKRRQKNATNLRGEERYARLAEVLGKAILDLARRYTSDWWWSGRLRYEKACKEVAKQLPSAAKRLIRRRRVNWKTVRYYTSGLRRLRREDFLDALSWDYRRLNPYWRQRRGTRPPRVHMSEEEWRKSLEVFRERTAYMRTMQRSASPGRRGIR